MSLLSNMNYRRRFNTDMHTDMHKKEEGLYTSNSIKETPTITYVIKMFILAYFSMMAIDIILYAYMKYYMKDPPIMPQPLPTTPPPASPPTTPPPIKKERHLKNIEYKEKKNTERLTRSMSAHQLRQRNRKKKGLDLFDPL